MSAPQRLSPHPPLPILLQTVAATSLGFAAVGLVEACALVLAHSEWFAPASHRMAFAASGIVPYALAGAIVGLALAAALLLLRILRPGAGLLAAPRVAALSVTVTIVVWGGFWINLHWLGKLLSPLSILCNLALVGAGAALPWLAGERPAASRPRTLLPFLMIWPPLVVASGVLLWAITPGLPTAPTGAPNVVLLVLDTVRADHLSCYGYPSETSPRIDALAQEGVRFDQAITTAPFTQAAVASILTGLHPRTHGVRNHPNLLAPGWDSLAELLRRQGYRTAFINCHPLLIREWGFAQGFDEYRYVAHPFGADARMLTQLLWRLRLRQIQVGYRAPVVTSAAADWLRRRDDRPFFLYAHYLDPHFEYIPPPPYDTRFAPGATAPTLLDARLDDGRRRIFGLDASPGAIRNNTALYDGEIAFNDAHVGYLLDALEQEGLASSTLVIVTADHGESLGEHDLWFAHTHQLYDTTQRVPLILRLPQQLPANRVVDRVVSVVDLVPTVLSILGLSDAGDGEGRDLSALIAGQDTISRATFAENGRTILGSGEQENPRWHVEGDAGKWRMIRTDRYKLISIPHPDGPLYELYDLHDDPQELHDLASQRPELREQLAQTLQAWIAAGAEAEGSIPTDDPETLERLRALGYIR